MRSPPSFSIAEERRPDGDYHDLVLIGGRVIDPETGLDAQRQVAVTGGRITAVTDAVPSAKVTVDVAGDVIAPGFIDLHSHAQATASMRLQACDGVTTALELEAGAASVDQAYARASTEGRPINFGFSASWAAARMALFAGLDVTQANGAVSAHLGDEGWGQPGTPSDLQLLLDHIEAELDRGALGVGLLLGYAPESTHREYLEVARLAARHDVPTFTHARHKNHTEPGTALQGIQEIVAAGLGSGAHMHLCHINSTSLRQIDLVTELIANARSHGVRLTTEAYPYGTSMTAIGAPFLHPDNLPRLALKPENITYVPTGERPKDANRLLELRRLDHSGFALVHYLDESRTEDRETLHEALLFADTAIASDALPLSGSLPQDDQTWPPPAGSMTHPRSSGTFARTLRILVRELGKLSLPEAIRRCTLIPAQVLANVAPAVRRKGRIQTGADADIVVFNPAAVTDRSTYQDPVRPSTGFRHVLVGGTFVLRDGLLDLDALPGQSIRGYGR